MKLTIAGKYFLSISAAKNHARLIRSKYKDFEKLTGEDDVFMRAYLALCKDSEKKIGCGIGHLFIQTDGHWGNSRQFVIFRTDGTTAITSILELRLGPPLPPESRIRRRVIDAMREAIADQQIAFKNRNFKLGVTKCPITDKLLVPHEIHVDHCIISKFSFLVAGWMKSNNLSFENIPVNKDSDKITFNYMTDAKQLASWRVYHEKRAVLRLLSKEGHISISRKKNGLQPPNNK